jgi:hypothetical protein
LAVSSLQEVTIMGKVGCLWAVVLVVAAGVGCGSQDGGGAGTSTSTDPVSTGPCTLAIVLSDVDGGGLRYATLTGHDCEELGPGPDSTTCWDPFLLRAPDGGGDTGIFRCCSGPGVDIDVANGICTAAAGD